MTGPHCIECGADCDDSLVCDEHKPDYADPTDDEKDKAMCEQCGGTGMHEPRTIDNKACWWCEGRGHRL